MPIRQKKFAAQGKEKATTLSQRDASPGGPAKFEWSISQGNKNEVKLTYDQMIQIIVLAYDWIHQDEREETMLADGVDH